MEIETTGDGTASGATAPPAGPLLPPQPGTPRLSTLAPPTGAAHVPAAAGPSPTAAPPAPPTLPTPATPPTQAEPPAPAAPPAPSAQATPPAPAAPAFPEVGASLAGGAFLPKRRALPPLAPIISIERSAAAETTDGVAGPGPHDPAARQDQPATATPPAASPGPDAAAPLARVVVPPVPPTVLHGSMTALDPTPPAGAPSDEASREAPPAFTPFAPLTLTPTASASPVASPQPNDASTGKRHRKATRDKAAPKGAPAAAAPERTPRRSPDARRQGSARSRGVTALVIVAVIGLLGAGAVLVQRATSSNERTVTWNAEVTPLVSFVEQARDAAFDQPVEVVHHTDADYAIVLASEHYRSAAPADPDYTAAVFHTLGLVPDFSAQPAQMHLAISHAEAFYSWTSHVIHVRGAEGAAMSPPTEAAVVQALVEAWYDQRFQTDDRAVSTVDVSFATADGLRLAARHAGTDLADSDLRDRQDWAIEGPLDTADVPWTIRDLIAAEALLPARLLVYTANHPEQGTLDSLTVGTLTESRLVAPWAPLPTGSTPDLDAPVPDDRTAEVRNESFPMLPMLVSLVAWTDWPTARAAVQGWRTAVSSTYRQAGNDALCLSVRVAFTDFPDAFVAGVSAWGAAMGRPITPVANGDNVQFSICDTAAFAVPFPTEKVGATASALLSIGAAATAKDEIERAALLCAADEVARSGAADEMLRTRDVARAIAEVLRPNLLQLARQCVAAG